MAGYNDEVLLTSLNHSQVPEAGPGVEVGVGVAAGVGVGAGVGVDAAGLRGVGVVVEVEVGF